MQCNEKQSDRDDPSWHQGDPRPQLDQCNVKGSCHLVKTLRSSLVGVWWDRILSVHSDPLLRNSHLAKRSIEPQLKTSELNCCLSNLKGRMIVTPSGGFQF